MRKFILKRLIQFLIVFIVITLIVFVMVRLSGMNVLTTILRGKRSTPADIAALRQKYSLDKPWYIQYFIWLSRAVTGNFGTSFRYQQPVSSLLSGRFSITLWLTIITIVFSVIFSIAAGIISAVKKNTWVDRLISLLSLVMLSTPGFFAGILLILIVSIIAPSVSFSGTFSSFGDAVQRLMFPSITLALLNIAVISRITRSNMIHQLQSEYVTYATSKGIPHARIILRHAFKNAVIPVITIVGIQIGALMSGTVLIENVFALPGIGSLLIEGIQSSDYPVVEALTLIFVAVFMVVNLVVDILYAVIDPRIRLE